MENKYYTPDTIEEVFEQLIYNKEIYIKGGDDDIFLFKIRPNKFPTDIFNFLEITNKVVSNNKVEYDFSSDSFLIKYLDQQDIEDFGFKFNGEDFISNKTYLGIGTGDDKKLIISNIFDYNYLIYYKSNRAEEFIVFDGMIKNKSELKKILQQIGVYD